LLELLRRVLQATGVLNGGLLAALCFAHAGSELRDASLDSVADRFELLSMLRALLRLFLLALCRLSGLFAIVLVFTAVELDVLSTCVGV
jgi:hypothetical protein